MYESDRSAAVQSQKAVSAYFTSKNTAFLTYRAE